MTFIQYYREGHISENLVGLTEVQEPSGRIVLNEKNTLNTMVFDAKMFNVSHMRRFPAFRIFHGSGFLDAQPITSIKRL
jgi:hypothetical protein